MKTVLKTIRRSPIALAFAMTFAMALLSPAAYASYDCLYDLCVGDTALNTLREYRAVRVLAIENSRKIVVRFLDTGGVGGGWDRENLALTRGCAGRYCVGDSAYNRERDYRLVTIVGLQWGGRYVLRFEDNGTVGGRWQEWDLVPVQNPPYPPYPPQPPVPPHPPEYDWVCHFTTPSRPEPGYVGRSRSSEREAFELAMQQCLGFETPYQCRRNSQMRCGQEIVPRLYDLSYLRTHSAVPSTERMYAQPPSIVGLEEGPERLSISR